MAATDGSMSAASVVGRIHTLFSGFRGPKFDGSGRKPTIDFLCAVLISFHVGKPLMVDCLIAFGANEGDPEASFRSTVEALRTTDGIEVTAVGEPMRTDPVGGPKGQPPYQNASIRLTTDLSAAKLHRRLIEIETVMGRERRIRWGSRTIDLDLLLYGDQQIETETLNVPHPRMSFRRFVLEPCLKIAGEMTHPTTGRTIAELLDILNQRANVAVLVNATAEFLDSLAQHDDAKRWKFVQAANQEQFNELQSIAKLMVVFRAETSITSTDQVLEALVLKFAGPMLDLRSSEEPVAEIIAALAAAK